jgi:aminoglycoside phosphotransferase (APT) family kinase protein
MSTPAREEALADALAVALGAGAVTDVARLSGGASRETWAFTADGTPLILQRERPGGLRKAGMATEVGLLRAAGAAGVPVPGVVSSDADAEAEALGTSWMIVDRVEGETIARKILRDDAFAGARPVLAAQCGDALARIHGIDPATVPGLVATDQVAQFREALDAVGEPHPAFELGFRWLEANRPDGGSGGRGLSRGAGASGGSGGPQAVVHGDFRNGNLVVGPDGLRAVLDWELAHLGDPLEDLGWLCVRAWRFGATPRVGGFGDVDELVGAYEATAGTTVDRDALHWWEVLGTLKWGIICVVQASTHLTGVIRSVELAAIGRRVCEVEHDLLLLLPGGTSAGASGDEETGVETGGEVAGAPAGEPSSAAAVTPRPPAGDGEGMPSGIETPGVGPAVARADAGRVGAPHDAPAAGQLVEAVREFLEGDVMGATEGRVRFHARVAGRALAIVERELAAGDAPSRAHAARLSGLGFGWDAELAAGIRSGALDDRWDEVAGAVRASVADKLAVANPSYAADVPRH